ncbi:MAG: FAD binding domain-containing protein [Treponema sp.]|nr:FAD binding domain-containing protein [Treponema sp.]
MDAPLNHVFFPSSFSELFSDWNRFPAAVPYAGGTNLIGRQEHNILNLPPVFLCLDKIEEMHSITRTEHYLEIGAMVKLNRLLRLGKIVPGVLCRCIENIAGVQLRNIATIGGNICSTGKSDMPAPLIALEAQYELRNEQNTRWVSAARFHSAEKDTVIENQELLTRIRLPLHPWDYSIYKKFYGDGIFSSESFIFLVKTQKNILSEIRVVYKSSSIMRNKDSEAILNGKYLPLNRKTAYDFVENWRDFLSGKQEVSEFSKNALLNSIEENVYNLSDTL